MAFVYKRGDIYYVAWREWVVDDKGNRKRIQQSRAISPDKQAAQEFSARKTLNAYTEKNKLTKNNMPIQEFFEDYKNNYSIKNKRQATLQKDEIIWKTFRRTCPEVSVTQHFDDTALNNYMSRRLKGIGSKTKNKPKKSSINREIGMLKNLARWGYRNRYLSSNYYDLVDRYSETDSQKKRPFTDDEIQKILDNTTYPQREAHILSIWHGMRAGEICALECSDFVWADANSPNSRDYIKIRNKPHLMKFVKTKQSARDIPIHPFWRNHLYDVWLKAKEKSKYFLLTRENSGLSNGGLSSYTGKLFKSLNFPKKEISFHSGRHTFATRIKDGGGSINIASRSLGHSNTRITEQVYTDFKPQEHFNVVEFVKIDIDKPKDTM